MHQQPLALDGLANLPFLDHYLTALEDVARIGEHAGRILVVVEDRDIRVRTDSKVPLPRQPQCPGRPRGGDNGDLVKRVLPIQFRQDDSLECSWSELFEL